MTQPTPAPMPANNPMPARRHTQGAALCTAHSKRTGQPCGQPALLGSDKCRLHCGVPKEVARARGLREVRPAAVRLIEDTIKDPDSPGALRLAASKIVVDNTSDDDAVTASEARRIVEALSVAVADLDPDTADAVLLRAVTHLAGSRPGPVVSGAVVSGQHWDGRRFVDETSAQDG